MTETDLRNQIATLAPNMTVVWIGRLADELEAVVQDAWGQYRWPWIGYQRGLLSETKPAGRETNHAKPETKPKTQATLF